MRLPANEHGPWHEWSRSIASATAGADASLLACRLCGRFAYVRHEVKRTWAVLWPEEFHVLVQDVAQTPASWSSSYPWCC